MNGECVWYSFDDEVLIATCLVLILQAILVYIAKLYSSVLKLTDQTIP